MTSLADSILRIWRDDQIAVWLTTAMVLFQLLVLAWAARRTGVPLRRRYKLLSEVATRLSHSRAALEIADTYLEHALRVAAGGDDDSRGGRDLEDLFDPERLLPREYNARLDAAGPGIFTALGILGTFLGLIVAFLRVDPAEAAGSVAPLIGGMVVAFVNSLLGVFLSIAWVVLSRLNRHKYDVACSDLLLAVERRFAPQSPADRALNRPGFAGGSSP